MNFFNDIEHLFMYFQPFLCPLWRYVCSILLPIFFIQVTWFFLVISLCVKGLISYQVDDLQIIFRVYTLQSIVLLLIPQCTCLLV